MLTMSILRTDLCCCQNLLEMTSVVIVMYVQGVYQCLFYIFFSLVHRLTVKLLFARVQRCKALWCGFELLCGITFGLCVDFFHGQCLLRYTP
jgi:hypothetical protein